MPAVFLRAKIERFLFCSRRFVLLSPGVIQQAIHPQPKPGGVQVVFPVGGKIGAQVALGILEGRGDINVARAFAQAHFLQGFIVLIPQRAVILSAAEGGGNGGEGLKNHLGVRGCLGGQIDDPLRPAHGFFGLLSGIIVHAQQNENPPGLNFLHDIKQRHFPAAEGEVHGARLQQLPAGGVQGVALRGEKTGVSQETGVFPALLGGIVVQLPGDGIANEQRAVKKGVGLFIRRRGFHLAILRKPSGARKGCRQQHGQQSAKKRFHRADRAFLCLYLFSPSAYKNTLTL